MVLVWTCSSKTKGSIKWLSTTPTIISKSTKLDNSCQMIKIVRTSRPWQSLVSTQLSNFKPTKLIQMVFRKLIKLVGSRIYPTSLNCSLWSNLLMTSLTRNNREISPILSKWGVFLIKRKRNLKPKLFFKQINQTMSHKILAHSSNMCLRILTSARLKP